MKVIIKAFLLFNIALFVSGCNQNNVIKNASSNDIQQMLDKKESGFVIITNEIDAPFLDEVQKALLEKKKDALQFNVFQNDGKSQNTDGLSKNPFRTEMPRVNVLYFIKGGTVYDEFNLEVYKDIRQKEKLGYFISKMSNSTGDSNG